MKTRRTAWWQYVIGAVLGLLAGIGLASYGESSGLSLIGAPWIVTGLLAVLGVLIAISRVVTGVHYISDVLAGLAFGSVFAVLGWNAFVLAASALGFYAIMLL